MKCDEIRNELSAYLDGEVAAPAREQIDAHVAECAGCRQRLEELRRLATGMAALPRLEPTPQFLAEVRARISRPEGRSHQVSWADVLFRPVWLKVPLEALAVIAVAATILVVQKPPARQDDFAALPSERRDESLAPAVDLEAPAETAAAPVPTASPEENLAARKIEEFADRREAEAKVLSEPEVASGRLAMEELKLAKDEVHQLPLPPQMAPAAPPAAGVEADTLTAGEVAITLTNLAAPAHVVIVHAGDLTIVRRQVATTAVRLGGRMLERPESQLNEGGRVVHTFRVQLPADQVANFANLMKPVSVQTRGGMIAPSAATSGTARGLGVYRSPAPATAAAAAKEKPALVEVEVRVVPE